MTILQLCNKAPYPSNDGSSIAITNLALGLADNDVTLHLLAINTKKHFKDDAKVDTVFRQKTHYQSVYQNTNTTFFGALLNLFSKQSYFVSRFYFEAYEAVLIKKLQETTFDIIQLEGVFMASYIPIIKKYSKAKIVLRSHNIEHQIWERFLNKEKPSLKKTYLTIQNNRLKKFELNAIQNADAIVTITDEDKKLIQQLVPSAVLKTCLTGVNLSEYKNVINPTQVNTVFHFASMDWLPNIEAVDWLLNIVWNDVMKLMPNAKLILAGRGMPARIKQKESKNILVIDAIENSAEFYNTYDIMLVPLWSGSGLRIKLVEGLAYGKAIVTTSIGAEGIPYTPNENLIIADTSQDFVNAIVKLLTQNDFKTSLQQHARVLAEKEFDYKVVAKKLLNFYNTLLS